MNLFFLRAYLRRQLLSTPKFEQTIEQTRLDSERYHKIEQSDKLREFLALEKQVASAEFQAKKKELTTKKYKDTDEAKKLARLEKLAKDKFVRIYLKTGEGDNRSAVMQYEELRKETESDEFIRRNAFWQDAHRWDNTEEGRQDARYTALMQDPDIRFYIGADTHAIEQFDRFEKVYEDVFNWTRLEASDWHSGMHYPSNTFVRDHAFANEQQAYNKGRNVDTAGGILHIKTIKEKVTAPAWDEKKGMVMSDFQYTSDVISNDKVAVEEGSVVQVKVRCSGNINHAVCLRGSQRAPLIHLFDFRKSRYYVGAKENAQAERYLKELDGLIQSKYKVFTVSWQKDELIWYINNMEVYRTKNLLPKGEKLYIHMFSSIPADARRVKEGEMQVDWIRVFKTKN